MSRKVVIRGHDPEVLPFAFAFVLLILSCTSYYPVHPDSICFCSFLILIIL